MTLTKRVIPCLDVANGRVVKGLNFKSIKDAGDPVLLAEKYSNEGADELVFLDITASEENREIIKSLVSKVAQVINIPFTVGGGVKTLQHARDILLSGADKVAINTGAVKNPKIITELMELFGRQCIVVAVDVKRNYYVAGLKSVFTDNGKKFWFEVFIYGGKKETGLDAIDWIKKMESLGAGEILLTSMDRDGTKKGYDLDLTKKVSKLVNIPVIASGGVCNLEHLHQGIKIGKASAVLAASIFHFGEHTILEAKQYLDSKGIPVRI